MAFPQSHLRGWLHMELRNHRRGKQPRVLLRGSPFAPYNLQRSQLGGGSRAPQSKYRQHHWLAQTSVVSSIYGTHLGLVAQHRSLGCLLLRAESSHTGLQRVSGKSSKCQSRVFAVKRMGVPEGHDYAGNVWTPPPTALSLTPVPNVLLLLPLLHRP